MTNYKYDVSIVIVCMNNLKNLYPCLDSIRKYTTCKYEVLVTAYLFTHDNLKKVIEDYPWVTFIESNEIRGFSENNNLALRQAKGKYCFVLNDDTYHSYPVIDRLFERFESLPSNVAVLSPNVLRPDGTIQHCGRPSINMFENMLDAFHYVKRVELRSKYCHKQGLFQTYNIHGAAFMIRRDVFEKFGWFDEIYFFCPEDIALSTLLNNSGYKCMVESEIKITHIGGGTWSKTLVATKPATIRGNVIFYCDNIIKKIIYRVFWSLILLLYIIMWSLKNTDAEKKRYMIKANKNGLVGLWSNKSAKELFVKYYNELKKEDN